MPESTPAAIAARLLHRCRRGLALPVDDIDQLTAHAMARPDGLRALFADLVEPLSDAFEPAWCQPYARLFARVIAAAIPSFEAEALVDRYLAIRHPRPCHADPHSVFVLSRITLGADVAVTSVLLDAAKQRFPKARIVFAGPPKNYELFNADPRIDFLPVTFARAGGLADRLRAGLDLATATSQPGALVLDPDSRLSQLGLIPMAPAHAHFFFESRSAGGTGTETLTVLTRRWVRDILQVDARPYIRPSALPSAVEPGLIAISLGVGENPAKRIPDPFEPDLIQSLAARQLPLLIDYGAGGEESQRVQRAIAAAGPGARIIPAKGPFAPFAAAIARSRLYFGYDSSGQHVAAVSGTPLVTVFAGHATPRTFDRWKPAGDGPSHVLRVDAHPTPDFAAQTLAAIDSLLSARIL